MLLCVIRQNNISLLYVRSHDLLLTKQQFVDYNSLERKENFMYPCIIYYNKGDFYECMALTAVCVDVIGYQF